MNNQEYETKKRECWEEYIKLGGNNNGNSAPFNMVFRYAYALGKQKETITQEEIEKAAEKHSDELRIISGIPGALVPMLHDIAKSSYLQGAQDFLVKQEKDADTVIRGWVARDANGSLNVFDEEPTRDEELEMWSDGSDHFGLPYSSFPDLTWSDEPQEVEIIIKRKKNGNNSTDNRI